MPDMCERVGRGIGDALAVDPPFARRRDRSEVETPPVDALIPAHRAIDAGALRRRRHHCRIGERIVTEVRIAGEERHHVIYRTRRIAADREVIGHHLVARGVAIRVLDGELRLPNTAHPGERRRPHADGAALLQQRVQGRQIPVAPHKTLAPGQWNMKRCVPGYRERQRYAQRRCRSRHHQNRRRDDRGARHDDDVHHRGIEHGSQ